MADISVKGSIVVDTNGAEGKIAGVRTELDKTGETMKKTAKGTDAASGSFGNLKGSLGSLPGPLGQAGGAVDGLSSKFKALLANPVGLIILAIVAALALLYKAFTNTFAGGQKMEQIFAGIKAAAQALIDNIMKLGGAIVKAMKFDFSGAIADIKGVAKEAGAAYTAMANLTKEAQNLKREQLANDLEGAERAKKLAILREQASDDSIPLAKRKAALKELQKDAEQNSKDDIDLAKRVTDNKIKQLTLEKDGALKNMEEINQLKIEQINVETDNANELRRIGKQITSADKAEDAERKQIQADAAARAKEAAAKAKEYAAAQKKILEERLKFEKELARFLKEGKMTEAAEMEAEGVRLKAEEEERAANEVKRLFDNNKTMLETKKKLADLNVANDPDSAANKIAKIKADLALELSALAEGDIQKQVLAQQASNAIVDIQKQQAEAERLIEEKKSQHKRQQLDEVGNAIGNLASIAGKDTIAAKALGIAQATINTYIGASEAIKAKSTLPSPFDVITKVANVASIIATGFKTVKAITAVKVPGGGGGGSTPSAPTISAPINPVQSSTTLDQNSINGIGNAAQGGVSRAYITDSDYRSANERNLRIERAARIG
jgi:hypothetical protein